MAGQLTTSKSNWLPAPTGGIDVSTSIVARTADVAVDMLNLYPQAEDVVVRPGSTIYSTEVDLEKPFRSIHSFTRQDGTTHNFAFVDISTGVGAANYKLVQLPTTIGGAIADITPVAPATPVPVSNDSWRGIQIGQQLILVNGVDEPIYVYGESGAFTVSNSNPTPAKFSGPTITKLNSIGFYRERAYLTIKDSPDVYYGAVRGTAGALTLLPVSYLYRHGGYTVHVDGWSRAGTDTVNTYLVVLSSNGEILIFEGTEPGDTDTWKISHRLKVPKPIGKTPVYEVNGDLEIITTNGIYSVNALLAGKVAGVASTAITERISSLWRADVAMLGSGVEWRGAAVDSDGYVIIKLPYSDAQGGKQWIRNIETGAWTRYDYPAIDLCVAGDDTVLFSAPANLGASILYVNESHTDNSGGGAYPVSWRFLSSYQTYGNIDSNKIATGIRPILANDGPTELSMGMCGDFNSRTLASDEYQAIDSTTGGNWDDSDWDDTDWGDDSQYSRGLYPLRGEGFWLALKMSGVESAAFSYKGSFIILEDGGAV